MTAYSLYLKFFRARIERIKELSEREKKNSKPKHNHIYKYRQQYFDQQCQESKIK